MTENRPAPLPNLPEYSVGEISRAIRQTLEEDFGHVRVRGEISNFKRHGSGHLYFSLKDEDALLDGCCWRNSAARLAVKPEDGLEVVCTGRITTYAGRSKYQIVVESMELAGEGALLKLLEERRRRLAAEGLFDESRKRRLPFLPEVIGVVTSPTGAVIRDILHRLRDRFPRRVLLWPVAVQGDGAAEQVAEALAGFNALPPDGPVPRPDLLIVARGGGSLEDLWAFNEEAVVRAIAASAIPVISAVGHETDTTLADFAADRRAPTPTAAAEMAVPVRADLIAALLDRERRLLAAATRHVSERRVRVEGLARGLPDPHGIIDAATQRLDDRAERLAQAAANGLARRASRLAETAARIRHPRETIAAKGFELKSCAQKLRHQAQTAVERAGRALERVVDDGRLLRAATRRVADGNVLLAAAATLLESYSYRDVLRRGFALVRQDGQPVIASREIRPGARLNLTFADGDAAATADGPAPPPHRVRPRSRAQEADAKQGTLL